ncbi:hypothetical protein VPH35_072682 [Triticum aestivum]
MICSRNTRLSSPQKGLLEVSCCIASRRQVGPIVEIYVNNHSGKKFAQSVSDGCMGHSCFFWSFLDSMPCKHSGGSTKACILTFWSSELSQISLDFQSESFSPISATT